MPDAEAVIPKLPLGCNSVLRRTDFSPPGDDNLIEHMAWMIVVADLQWPSLAFVASVLSYHFKNGFITDRQTEGAQGAVLSFREAALHEVAGK